MELPPTWQFRSLRSLNQGGISTLDPTAFPRETFEYYSIPAYQDGRNPLLVLGATILSQKQLIPQRCVLFGKLNPRVEKVWFVKSHSPHRRLASTEWLTIVPTHEINQAFLYFVLWSDWVMPKAQSLVSGSTPSRERVEPRAFYEIEIPVPPLWEQERIAAVLWKLQESIDLQGRLLELAREMKKSAMRQLFTSGLRGEPRKDTDIGPLPFSWNPRRLEDCCEVVSSSLSYTDFFEMQEAQHDWVVAMGIKVSDMNLPGNELRIVKANLEKRVGHHVAERKLVPPETVVFPKRGAAIATNKKRMTTTWTVLDPNLIAVRAGEHVNPGFLFQWFQQFDLRTITDPGPTPQLNKKNLTPLLLPIPGDPTEQSEIAQILQTLEANIGIHERKRAVLQELFRTLLQQLMTGQVRVDHLEIDVAEVAAA